MPHFISTRINDPVNAWNEQLHDDNSSVIWFMHLHSLHLFADRSYLSLDWEPEIKKKYFDETVVEVKPVPETLDILWKSCLLLRAPVELWHTHTCRLEQKQFAIMSGNMTVWPRQERRGVVVTSCNQKVRGLMSGAAAGRALNVHPAHYRLQ